MKLFAVNNRDNLLPKIWGICNLDPLIPNISDQYIWFTFQIENKNIGIAAVYASTCHIKRRTLWNDLRKVNSHATPWCMVGDFNAILGAHRHRGPCTLNRTPMSDFKTWSESNNLLELPSKGKFFNWYNGRSGRASIEQKLDRAIFNMIGLMVVSTFDPPSFRGFALTITLSWWIVPSLKLS